MNNFVNFRNVIIDAYKRNYNVYSFIIKFVLGTAIYFSLIYSGYENGVLGISGSLLFSAIISLGFALTFAFFPYQWSYFFMIIAVCIGLSSSVVVAILTSLLLFIIFILYTSVSKKESIVLLITAICFSLNIPYFAPIFAGIIYKKTAFIPVFLGVFTYYLIGSGYYSIDYVNSQSITGVSEVAITSVSLMLDYLKNNAILALITFPCITLIVNLISHSIIDYNREIAILVGCILFFIIVTIYIFLLGGDMNIFLALISIIGSGLLSYIAVLFDGIFDYTKVKKVYFQDEDNIYYVKVVAKIK